MSDEEKLFSDYKEYEASGVSFGIGLISVIDEEMAREIAGRMKDGFPDFDEYDGTSYIYRSGLGRKTKFVPGLTDYLAR